MSLMWMLTDDESTFQLELIIAVDEAGLGEIETFDTGGELLAALREAKANDACPDIVLADWNLTTSQAHEQKARLIKDIIYICGKPVLVISGAKQGEEIKEAQAAGASGWIWKLADDLSVLLKEVSAQHEMGWSGFHTFGVEDG